MRNRLMLLVALLGVGLALSTIAWPQLTSNAVELRYCSPVPIRTIDGSIMRSAAIVRDFRKIHPCPTTGNIDPRVACPGWSVDHVIPLDCGGCDAVSNMQWLPLTIKSCAGTQCKDRWERKIYCSPFQKVSP